MEVMKGTLEFAIDQIKQTIEHDCDYHLGELYLPRNLEEYKEEKFQSILDDLERYRRWDKESEKRRTGRLDAYKYFCKFIDEK
jgi:hypothetical protein